MFQRWPKRDTDKNYFERPNEIFCLGLDSSEISTCAYLLRCEDRKTYVTDTVQTQVAAKIDRDRKSGSAGATRRAEKTNHNHFPAAYRKETKTRHWLY